MNKSRIAMMWRVFGTRLLVIIASLLVGLASPAMATTGLRSASSENALPNRGLRAQVTPENHRYVYDRSTALARSAFIREVPAGSLAAVPSGASRSTLGGLHPLPCKPYVYHAPQVLRVSRGAAATNTPSGPTLFRGTSSGYPGSPAVQQLGITPASTDPAVATAFATEASQYGQRVVHIASPADLAGAKLYPPTLGGLEAEIPVGVTTQQFASSSGATISAAQG